MFAQNAGNRISEVLDFKISRGSMPPDPPNGAMHLRCIGPMHRSKISVDPRLGTMVGKPKWRMFVGGLVK